MACAQFITWEGEGGFIVRSKITFMWPADLKCLWVIGLNIYKRELGICLRTPPLDRVISSLSDDICQASRDRGEFISLLRRACFENPEARLAKDLISGLAILLRT